MEMEIQPSTQQGLLHAVRAAEPIRGHERSALLAQKVRAAKASRLNCCELALRSLGTLCCAPLCCLGVGWQEVKANSSAAFFRFGKLERVVTQPGLTYVTPGAHRIDGFAGTQSLILPQQNIIDAAGNPVVIRALLEYSVDDPAALAIATNNTPTVLFNMAEQVVRETVAGLPLQGHPEGRDLRSQGHAVSNAMVAELQIDATVMGVTVQRLVITEARYAPEIMAQMLMKQQAQALSEWVGGGGGQHAPRAPLFLRAHGWEKHSTPLPPLLLSWRAQGDCRGRPGHCA